MRIRCVCVAVMATSLLGCSGKIDASRARDLAAVGDALETASDGLSINTLDDGGDLNAAHDAAGTPADARVPGDFAGCPNAPYDTEDPIYTDRCTKVVYVAGGYALKRLVVDSNGTKLSETYDSTSTNGGEERNWAVAIGRGVIVVAGDGGVMTSTDGVNFTTLSNSAHPTTVPPSTHTTRLLFVNNRFLLLYPNGAWYSTDGTTWTMSNLAHNWSTKDVDGFAYGNGRAVGVAGTTVAVSTDDGATYTTSQFSGDPAGYFHSLTFGNGVFVMQDNQGFHTVSTDGVTWTHSAVAKYSDNTTVGYEGEVSFNGSEFLGLPGAGGQSATSANGYTWAKSSIGHNIRYEANYDGKIAGISTAYIYTSTDGIAVTSLYQDTLATTQGLFTVAVGRINK